jgi:hypothetical protein
MCQRRIIWFCWNIGLRKSNRILCKWRGTELQKELINTAVDHTRVFILSRTVLILTCFIFSFFTEHLFQNGSVTDRYLQIYFWQVVPSPRLKSELILPSFVWSTYSPPFQWQNVLARSILSYSTVSSRILNSFLKGMHPVVLAYTDFFLFLRLNTTLVGSVHINSV